MEMPEASCRRFWRSWRVPCRPPPSASVSKSTRSSRRRRPSKSRSRAAGPLPKLRNCVDLRKRTWHGSRRSSTTEIERIRRDADRRTDERRKNLEVYLAKHESIIATEIDGVDTAIRGYRAALDRFFDEFTSSTDPADIARRAGTLPAPPDLDEVRATARVNAVAELANAPDDAAAGPVTDEQAPVVEGDPVPAAGDEAGDEPPSMRRQVWVSWIPMPSDGQIPCRTPSGEVDAETVPTFATAPPADALYVEPEDSVEATVAESADHSSAAVRLLRSIAPWASQADQDEPDRHSESG